MQQHPQFRYMVFQEERSASGTRHYQGYIEFKNTIRFNNMQNLFHGKAHLEPRRGTRNQARNYCMKEESRISGPYEVGDWLKGGQGTRTDLLALSKEIQTGASEADIASEYPVSYIKFHRGINKLIMMCTPARTEPPVIILCYGKTGTGKTKYCYDKYSELYRKPCDTRWFDNYVGQKVLLLDDFGGAMSKMSLLYLLQLLDRYPLIVEAKGKYVHMEATTILLTTNIHPRLWYNYNHRESSYAALKRRIHKVFHFKKFGQMHMCLSKDSFFDEWFESCNEDSIFIEETQVVSLSSSDDGAALGISHMSISSSSESGFSTIGSSDSDGGVRPSCRRSESLDSSESESCLSESADNDE